MGKKILLICSASIDVMNFRRGLIEALKRENYEISVIAFDELRRADIEALGVRFFCVADKNRGLNPFRILSLKGKYAKIVREVKPDVVFTFALKPNTFGVAAAKKAGVENIYSMVEGAGDVFINNSLKWKIIRKVVCALYKRSFRYSKKVFFLNEDDKAEFISRKLVKPTQCEIVHGIGVDLERFAFSPITNDRTFLMVARMLKTKGVMEYCQAARLVKRKYPDATFNYLGAEGTVKVADIQEYIDDGSVCYLGTTTDVRPYLNDCTAMILPSSYREGLPMSIMEAEATGRVIITTDNVGCRDTVKDGYNGFLVEVHDVEKTAERAIWLIEHFEETVRMGENSRTFAQEHFDKEKINRQLLETIRGN